MWYPGRRKRRHRRTLERIERLERALGFLPSYAESYAAGITAGKWADALGRASKADWQDASRPQGLTG